MYTHCTVYENHVSYVYILDFFVVINLPGGCGGGDDGVNYIPDPVMTNCY